MDAILNTLLNVEQQQQQQIFNLLEQQQRRNIKNNKHESSSSRINNSKRSISLPNNRRKLSKSLIERTNDHPHPGGKKDEWTAVIFKIGA